MKTKEILILLLVVFGLSAELSAQSAENVLRPGDGIIVKLSGVPAEEITVVSTSYDISDHGTINLPYIGELKAAGMRPSSLQKAIESAYRSGEIFTHPTIQVMANKDGGGTQVLFVSGEVKASGRIQMSPNMTVLDAITSAGGPTDFGDMRKVKLTRGGNTRLLDLKKVDGPDAALLSQPGDKIHVPQ
jgi:polysaccharide export outer membrane protein